MTSLRPLRFALATIWVLAATGCRNAGVGNLAAPAPLASRADRGAAELLADHNRNAERVQRIEAQPSVASANRGAMGGLGGKLALERPRNFRLVLSTPLQEVADIGSNDEEFWFWAKDSREKAVYYSRYDEANANPLTAGLQPDWIIEAMGLRVVSDEEAARIKVTPGKAPGTLLLSLRQNSTRGDVVIKDSILSETTHRLLEHWVYASDHKTALAHAVVSDYQDMPDLQEPGEKVYLPRKVRLEWVQEKMALDVTLGKAKVNAKITPEQRQARFEEPKFKGFARVNLAERSGSDSNAPTSVRESLPAPPPRVQLSDPAPLGIDGAMRAARRPAALDAQLPPASSGAVEEVVSPPIPTITDPLPDVVEYRAGWRNSLSSGIER